MAKPDAAGFQLAGRIALVTGAASGIGRATALLLAQRGAQVAVTDVNERGCREVAETIQREGGGAMARRLDVTLESDWEAALKAVASAWGALDALVANAGVSFARPVAEMTLEDWRRVMAVNLDGVFLGCKHAVRAMRAGKGGAIVIVSSLSGVRPFTGASGYAASKAALRMLARCLALECARDGIRVNTVLPAGVRTPMWKAMDSWDELMMKHGSEDAVWKALSEGSPMGRFAEPEEVAACIAFLLSDESSYVSGSELVIDGGDGS
jgi:NAD(P)-dependent dehydrogenase (short-subunit alcohol dehydrogenase family)